MAGTHLLRIRDLRTNFYTYQGVVRALDGIDLDMMKGETIGLVGETGCGKSVTALSILRLIPSPPGKVEEGEALFDVSAEDLERIDVLKETVRKDFVSLFGKNSRYVKSPLGAPILAEAAGAVERAGSLDATRKKETLARFKELRGLLVSHDLLAKNPDQLRLIRGHQISMIFQEPMQALNPVYTVGDQISESIILHRRRWLARRVTLRMHEEALRRGIARELQELFRGRTDLPPGIDLKKPARSDLIQVLDVLEKDPKAPRGMLPKIRELVNLKAILATERSDSSVFARGYPKAAQFRTYKHECLHSGWAPADVLEELGLAVELRGAGGTEVPWGEVQPRPDGSVLLLPKPGSSPEALLKQLSEVVKANGESEYSWSALGDILEPPKLDKGGVLLRVRKAYLHPSRPLQERLVARLPFIKRPLLHAQRQQALHEAAGILSLLKIPDPERVEQSYPHELSGGMNQRALIAIALSCDPLLLIADEPTTALDVTIQAQILELLKTLKQSGRPSILIITHDLGVIADICDRVCVMYGGVIVEDAPVREIFKDPKHPYTKGLLRAIPSHAVKKDSLDTIPGSVPNLIYPPGGCRFHPRCPVAMPICGWDSKDLEERIKVEAAQRRVEDAIVLYERPGVTRLEVTFVEGEAGVAVAKQIRAFVEEGRAASVLFQAVTGMEAKNNVLAFSLAEPVKPAVLETSPGHKVSCLLYGPGEEGA